jgi:DNA polymerase I-like protein with 3'-5' exonuclease and polymerase domains
MKTNTRTKEAYQLMHNGILALARAEQQGIRVDVDFVKSKMTYLTKRIDRLERQFKSTKFFEDWGKSTKQGVANINSPTQLSHFLYNIKKLPPPKYTKSSTDEKPKGSTDVEALKQLNIPELNMLL